MKDESRYMPPGSSGLSKRLELAMVLAIPFISWGDVPILTGVFSFLVLLVFLLRLRSQESRARDGNGWSYVLSYTSMWIPLGLILVLGLVHLSFSPVPYSSILFLFHMSLAGCLYFLLLDGPGPPTWIPVTLWSGILVSWMALGKMMPGAAISAGPFGNPNYLATILLTGLAFSLGSLISADIDGKRYSILLPVGMILTGALAFIGSRSAGIAIVILWSVYLLMGRGGRRFMAVALVAIIMLAPTKLTKRIAEGDARDPHAYSRTLIWKGALDMGLDHPFIGVGPNLYYEHAPRYAFPTEELPVRFGRIARKPHNEYLKVWAEGGVFGVGTLLGFLFLTMRFFLLSWREGRKGEALAVAVFLFQALFHDLTEVFALAALGAFWLAALSRGQSRSIEIRTPVGRAGVIMILLTVLSITIALNLDSSARMLWKEAQETMATDGPMGMKILARVRTTNPLLPGPSRDLAWGRLAMYRMWGGEEELMLARNAINDARRLNRLDPGPLRMEADLMTELAARLPVGQEQRSGAYLEQGKELLLEALELEPYNALIMVQLADVLERSGEKEKALEEVEKALTLEPNFLEAHRVKLRLLGEVDPSRIQLSGQDLDRAIVELDGYTPMSTYEGVISR